MNISTDVTNKRLRKRGKGGVAPLLRGFVSKVNAIEIGTGVIIASLLPTVVLAQKSRFEMMAGGLQKKSPDEHLSQLSTYFWIFCILVVLGLVIWGLCYYYRRSLRKYFSSKDYLFYELCKTHKLSKPEQSVLLSIVKGTQLAQPASIFLEPHRLAVAQTSDKWKSKKRVIELLQQKIYQTTE
ncbi:MAG: hypothetical protein MPJ24_02210 [Pirellulaceae bacterium]|nr:hypothetical protein [Pirellulaceae bacterium]